MEVKYHLDKKKITRIAIIVTVVFLLDQVTKWIAYHYLQPVVSVPVMGDFFRLTYVENPGMAFGIRIANRFIFNSLSIIAAVILVFYLTHLYPQKKAFTYSIACILGGAFGNLYDRLMHGVVIDFFDFDFFNISIPPFKFLFIDFGGYNLFRWPVFNIADMAVSLGMVFIFVNVFWEYERKHKKKTTESPGSESGVDDPVTSVTVEND